MRRLELRRKDSGLRARRWDAIVLGSALPGLVAAARMGQRGHRVLIVEEEAAARLPGPVADPFYQGPPGGDGVVDACLAALKIGLRDRRRIEADGISYQVISPGARVDVASPGHTAGELVSWGLAKPEPARRMVRALAEAAQGQLALLLDAPLVRRSMLRGLSRGRPATPAEPRARQLPDLGFLDDPTLSAFFGSQTQALCSVSGRLPLAARARLLGAPLLGGGSFSSSEVTLRRLLRRRIEELHGELRTVREFELVSVDPHPGVALPVTREVWLGRVLVLNAQPGLLAQALREDERTVPDFLDAPPPRQRSVTLDLRCEPGVIPEGMARRVVVRTDPTPDVPARVMSIARWPGAAAHDAVHLVARTRIGADEDMAQAREWVAGTVHELMPFAEGRILQREHRIPRWDDGEVALDPMGDGTWPPEAELRISSRPPIFSLPRQALGSLGTEGDVLLGWRAGDAISEEL
ncbi:MAG: hypothetical protein ABFS46_15325 [Myxococcota bacterium]